MIIRNDKLKLKIGTHFSTNARNSRYGTFFFFFLWRKNPQISYLNDHVLHTNKYFYRVKPRSKKVVSSLDCPDQSLSHLSKNSITLVLINKRLESVDWLYHRVIKKSLSANKNYYTVDKPTGEVSLTLTDIGSLYWRRSLKLSTFNLLEQLYGIEDRMLKQHQVLKSITPFLLVNMFPWEINL